MTRVIQGTTQLYLPPNTSIPAFTHDTLLLLLLMMIMMMMMIMNE